MSPAITTKKQPVCARGAAPLCKATFTPNAGNQHSRHCLCRAVPVSNRFGVASHQKWLTRPPSLRCQRRLFSFKSTLCCQASSQLAKRNWQERAWSALNSGACLASVAGAVGFFLTSEALLLGLPVSLPLVALVAGKQQQKLRAEVGRIGMQVC